MALKVAEIDYEHREILLRDKPEDMLRASPKGTVPVFVCADGQVIDESLEIMHWALGQNDPQNWLRPDREAMANLIAVITGPFKDHLDRYKYPSRYGKDLRTDPDERDNACVHLAQLERNLSTHAYLMQDRASLADYAIMPFIRQFAHTDMVWWESAPYPELRRWLDRLKQSALFLEIMKKHALYEPDVEAV